MMIFYFYFCTVIFETFASMEESKVQYLSQMLGKLHFLLLLLSYRKRPILRINLKSWGYA